MPPTKSPRKWRTAAAAGVSAIAFCAVTMGLYAQDPPPAPTPKPDALAKPIPAQAGTANSAGQSQEPQQPTLKVTVNQVVVPVTVKDGNGRLVPDITSGEFRIFDDDVEQHIQIFRADPQPLSAVILIDNDLKRSDAEQVESSLLAIVSGLSVYDEALVARYDSNFHPGKGFTKDQDKLVTELKRTKLDKSKPSLAPPSDVWVTPPTINGGQTISGTPGIPTSTTTIQQSRVSTDLDDAVYEAAQVLKDRGKERRKIIFLISDGANSKNNTNAYENVVKDLLKYNIAVYSVGVGSAFYNRKFTRLQAYANSTGGDIYYAAKRSTLEELYSRIAEQARNLYTLVYSPTGNDKSKDYHTIEVRVRREGLTIKTREGYYASGLTQ